MREPIEPLLDTVGVAKIFLVSPTTIRRWRSAGKLRAVRVGRELRFDRAAIEHLLQADAAEQRSVQPQKSEAAALAAGGPR
jgi:excisionase family DNA binding protein